MLFFSPAKPFEMITRKKEIKNPEIPLTTHLHFALCWLSLSLSPNGKPKLLENPTHRLGFFIKTEGGFHALFFVAICYELSHGDSISAWPVFPGFLSTTLACPY